MKIATSGSGPPAPPPLDSPPAGLPPAGLPPAGLPPAPVVPPLTAGAPPTDAVPPPAVVPPEPGVGAQASAISVKLGARRSQVMAPHARRGRVDHRNRRVRSSC